MKRVLITGANSYIGTSFEKYVQDNYPNDFQIETLDMLDKKWKEHDFSTYDTIFHVAGIAHADVGHVSEERKKLYYTVNCELAVETAKKAKQEGCKQFIYMSSIIVFGDSAPFGKNKIITEKTVPSPANFYGDSKLQADVKLQSLVDESFKVCILRPPMIYGPGSKGNYPVLSKLAKQLPVFPKVKNQRSMLYIENLCEFICLMIRNKEAGIFYPQNSEYSSTAEIVKIINPKIKVLHILNPFIWLLSKIPGKTKVLCNKALGNLVYDESLSHYVYSYCKYDLRASVLKTEGKL